MLPTRDRIPTQAARSPGHRSRPGTRSWAPAGDARLPGLDLLRGVAVGLVLLRHSWPNWFGGAGIVGVVIFFTLSGYLITGLLLAEFEDQGRIRFGRFYRRRAIRLYPAMLVMVAAVAGAELLASGLHGWRHFWASLLTGVCYLGDVPVHLGANPSLGHLWTLAIEEQFYLLWPLLLALAAVRGRLRITWLATVVLAVAVAAGMVVTHLNDPGSLYILPSSWAIALLLGCGGRIFRDQVFGLLSHPASVTFAVAALAVLCVPDLKGQLGTYLVGAPAISVASLCLIAAVSTWTELSSPVSRLLARLGLISYAVYLWNYPVTVKVHGGTESSNLSLVRGSGVIVATVLVATFSWLLLEKPIQRRVRRGRASGSHRPATAPPS